jgi:hypothetical protein
MQMAIELFIWGPHRDPSLMLREDILTVLPSAWHFLCILRLFSADWHAAAQLAFVICVSLSLSAAFVASHCVSGMSSMGHCHRRR